MPWADRTAPDEIHRRIKEISKQESALTYKAGSLRAEIKEVETKREELATKRRQYEYALKVLDGDLVRIPIEVTESTARIVHVNRT